MYCILYFIAKPGRGIERGMRVTATSLFPAIGCKAKETESVLK
jgi:hypothetical protein